MKKPTFMVSVNALIKKDGKFLITQRSLDDNFMPGYRWLPGGKLEYEEWWFVLEKTIHKEAVEEVWLILEKEIKPISNLIY